MDLPPRARAWVLGVEVAAVAAPLISTVATVGGAPPPQAIGLAALLASSRRRAHRARHRHRTGPPPGRAVLLLRPQLGVDVRRQRCSCPPPLAAAVVAVVYAAPVAAGVAALGRAAAPPRLHDRDRRAGRDGGARGRDRERAACPPDRRTWPELGGIVARGAGLRRGEHRAHRGGHRAVAARHRRPGASSALGRQRAGDRHPLPGRARRRGARCRAVPRRARRCLRSSCCTGPCGAPARGGGEPSTARPGCSTPRHGTTRAERAVRAQRPGGGGRAHPRPRPLQGRQRHHGHLAGDDVLAAVAARCGRRARAGPRRPVRRRGVRGAAAATCRAAGPGGPSCAPSPSGCAARVAGLAVPAPGRRR